MKFFPLVALPLLLLFSACGNDPHPPPLHTTRPDGSPWIVRYAALPDEIRSLDPQVMADQVSASVLDNVHDQLLAFHPLKTDPYELYGQMLADIPPHTTEADGTVTYLCQLKAGIHFHDDPCFPGGKGREVVAKDVQYAFQRICDPPLESPFQGTLVDYVAGMNDAVERAKKAGHYDYDTNHVSGIEVLDPHTFKIHLSHPYPQILYWLALPCTTPVAREAVEYYDGKQYPEGPGGKMVTRPVFKFHPVGTGPFLMVEHQVGQRFRFVRFEGYHTETFPTSGWSPERAEACAPLAGHPMPLVDEIQTTIFRELLPSWLLGRQGYLDRIALQKAAASAALTPASQLTEKFVSRGMKLERYIDVSTFFMVLNMSDPLLGPNKKLRQALSCAYDPQGFIDMLYGGVAPVAQQLLPPGIFGFQKEYRNPYGPNLEKARQLMAEAGYPGGKDPKTGAPLEISMDVAATGGEERQLFEYEQQQFEHLGIRVKVIENTFARMMEKQDNGNFQISTGSGWGADYPDAENFFFLFYSHNFPPLGKNAGLYKNEEFDRLFEKMASMENSPERLELIKRMNDILIEDCPMILNFNKAGYMIIQPWAPLTETNSMLPGSGYGGQRWLPVYPEKRAEYRRAWNPVPKWPLYLGGFFGVAGVAAAVHINRRRVA